MAWVYILKCADGSYYVGSTTDLAARIWQHIQGIGAQYTAKRRPVELVFAAEYENIQDAFNQEKRLQGWSRAKKEALIRGDFSSLLGLSRKDFERRTILEAVEQPE
jgi:putative endonuclease